MMMAIDPVLDALLIIDMQPDFMPGGPLAVADGDSLIDPIVALIPKFKTVVATQDWHPADHVSFASQRGSMAPFQTISLYGHDQTLWPDHCVQGTRGAKIVGQIRRHPGISLVLRKGADRNVDSYSAFRENYGPDGKRRATGLMGFLFERGVRRVFVCGLARDYCVKWSALDAVANGALKTHVLWGLTRAVDTNNDAMTLDELLHAGVACVMVEK